MKKNYVIFFRPKFYVKIYEKGISQLLQPIKHQMNILCHYFSHLYDLTMDQQKNSRKIIKINPRSLLVEDRKTKEMKN